MPPLLITPMNQDKYGNSYMEGTWRISERIYFEHKKLRYFWNTETETFKQVCGATGLTKKKIRSMARGLTEIQAAQNLEHFGLNTILVELRPVWALIFDEVSSGANGLSHERSL